MVLTPTYHVFDLYQAFMGATPYAATTDAPDYAAGVPMVDVVAAKGQDGKLWLSLVNTDPAKPAHLVTNLAGSRAWPYPHGTCHGQP